MNTQLTTRPTTAATRLTTAATPAQALRDALLHLAREQDDLACAESATVPYWAPTPSTVGGHRLAATALREAADQVAATTQHAPI